MLDGNGTGTLSEQCDIVRIASEAAYEPLHPAQCRPLVIQAEIAVPAVFPVYLFMCQIAEDPDPVIYKNGDDAALCQLIAAERFFFIGSGIETAAVDEHRDRTVPCIRRCIDIQVQTVFVISERQAFPEFPVVKQTLGIIQLREELPVLRTGTAKRRCIYGAFICIDHLRIAETPRPRIRDTEELTASFCFNASHTDQRCIDPDLFILFHRMSFLLFLQFHYIFCS